MNSWVVQSFETSKAAKIIVGVWQPVDAFGQFDWFAHCADAIINVSDHPCYSLRQLAKPSFWFPLLERGRWPAANLFAIKRTIDAFNRAGKTIYIHCYGSGTRAKASTALWLLSHGSSVKFVHAEELAGLDNGELDLLMNLGRFTKCDLDMLRASHEQPGLQFSSVLSIVDSPCQLPELDS